MHVEVNGTRLWFDVDGPSLVPVGSAMRERPTVVLVHGGPGGYDHSCFKPAFAPLARDAQVVFLDLRGHGRSLRGDPAAWDFEVCARDVRCVLRCRGDRPAGRLRALDGRDRGDAVRGPRPGSRGGDRAPVDTRALRSRTAGGGLPATRRRRHRRDRAACLGGESVSRSEWARAFACFGPSVPGEEQLARRTGNPELGIRGMELLRALDVRDALQRVDVPTLVCVGALDPVTLVDTARELVAALPRDRTRLEILENAGHFPWLDDPDRYWPLVSGFVRATAGRAGLPG